MKDIQTYLNTGWAFIHGATKIGDWIMPNNSYPKLAWQVYTPVTIPNLRGLTEEQARIALDEAGLLCGEIYSVYDVSIAAGLVSETEPVSGTTGYIGLTPIHILLAKETKYAGGDGVTTPYQIANLDHWFDIINTPTDWNKSFILTADINLNGISFSQSPIAPDSNRITSGFQGISFSGIFDGNDHTISNLTIAAPDKDYVGIFGHTSPNGQIKNLELENFDIQGRDYVGGLAGSNDSNITSCDITGDVVGVNQYAGGLVGRNHGAITSCSAAGVIRGNSYAGGMAGNNDGIIESCYTTDIILATDQYTGGLVGYNSSGTITSCFTTGSLNGTSYLGGIVGYNSSGTITSCFTTGSLNGTSYVGGIVGYNSFGTIASCSASGSATGISWMGGMAGYNSYGTITSCYAKGAVSGTQSLGGLLGYNDYGLVTNCYSTGSVTGSYSGGLLGYNFQGKVRSCYATGAVTGQYNCGGLVGYKVGGTVTSSFWDINTAGMDVSDGGVGSSTIQMQTKSTFTNAGWDFVGEVTNGPNDIWDICDGTNYPKLAWQVPLAGDIVCPDGVDWADVGAMSEVWLKGKLAADVFDNKKGIVDLLDWAIFANAWQTTTESPLWNAKCDIAPVGGDGVIDENDLGVFAEQWLLVGATAADISQIGGDGIVNMLDYAVLADNWLAAGEI